MSGFNLQAVNMQEFIEALRLRSEIYDPTHPGYGRRKSSLMDLAVLFGMTVKEATTKYSSLRTQFIKEHKKVLRSMNAANDADRYVSKWKNYDAMSFLSSVVDINVLDSDSVDSTFSEANADIEAELPKGTEVVSQNKSEPQSPPSAVSTPRPTSSTTSSRKRPASDMKEKRRNDQKWAMASSDLLYRRPGQPEDEDQIFEKIVVAGLKKIKSEKAKAMCKIKLLQTLFDFQFGDEETLPTTSIVKMPEENGTADVPQS